MDDVISHSSRRTFFAGGSNSGSHKSAYDDVFGSAAPKLPLPALAPRLEDYSEIFVGGSRPFSIPFLDLPPLAGGDSNRFDYAEVFGGVDFALSSPTEDFAAAGYDSSSDEQLWSPAQSESLSDELDPLSRSDKSLRLSDADRHQSLESTTQFNVSYDESPDSCDEEDENCSASVINDPNGKRVAEDHGNFTCKPFMTVSDISLRTKPSLLPPPSRPPPALKRGSSDTDKSYLECKASRSYAFESVTDEASSLSTLSPEGNKDADNCELQKKTAENRDHELSRGVEKDSEKRDKLIHENEVTKERNRDALVVEDSGLRFTRVDTDTDLCHTSVVFKTKGHIDMSRTADAMSGNAKETEPIGSNESAATTVPMKQYNQGSGKLKADLNHINYEGKTIGFIQHKNEGIAVKQDTPQFISETDSFIPCQVIRESSVVNGMKEKDSDDTLYSIKNGTRPKIETRDHSKIKENLAAKGQKVGERIRRDIELENEHIRKIEEEREREREREKDRMAVDKATLEACERSYTEARERAAVDRAIAEVRQRAMETRLRTKRAAIDRATSDARQRAAEKSMSQKASFDAHFRVERSASFKYSDARQSSLSSVTDTHLKSTGTSSNLRYSYSFGGAGTDSDSPQRCKARLERYQRTAERAAKALAEKNMRDLLVQREREEMNRVAETLDSEIKRWSGGKESNLRALLSTLQYILGPDSGWQPVPLTEVITLAAVKRAYRKATLCVHPDKLQQRGATIQQKYICEKVFDLLKEAWNKFNSEEM